MAAAMSQKDIAQRIREMGYYPGAEVTGLGVGTIFHNLTQQIQAGF